EQNWQAVNTGLRTIARLDPNDIDSRLQLATISLFAGRFQDALEWADGAIAIDGNNARVIAIRAATLIKMGDEANGLQQARRSLELQ
ncbi:hypothetical protein ABTP68_19700, partial [Acinetobacter baumannii]